MASLLLSILAITGAVYGQHIFPDCENGPLKNNTVCDTSATVRQRAQALTSVLTVAEKISLLGNTSPGVERVGLPAYQWWQEALHGVASSPGVNFASSGNYSYATSFPQPILMGAAFDDDLINKVATVVSTEARSFNNVNRSGLDYWTPNINNPMDIRWGREQETPGEDPYHVSSYVKALINGLQGGQNPPIKKIVATCKHFAAYDLENWDGITRYEFDAQVTTQDLAEFYLPAFQACARDANVGSIMCSYNALNGVPTCADPYLLEDILRQHWNWVGDDQYITSDCDAIQNIYMPHDYTNTSEQAVADALNAGTDLNCGTYYQIHLPAAYAQGLVNETTIDQSIVRLYSALVKLGYFDPASATSYRSLTFADVSTPEAEQLALQAAEEGMTLLKNDGILPLQSTNMTIALIGSWANATTQMQGNYYGVAPYLHSPLYAAQRAGFKVNYAAGVGGQGDPTTDDWMEAISAANASDLIIIADGIDISVEAEGMDRYTLNWTGGQLDLNSYLATMKPTVLAQFGGQLDDTPFLNNPNFSAIVWGGYPGQSGGDALFNILLGKTAPAGRLPTTQYPARYVDQVPLTDMNLRPNATTGNPGRTYKWYNESVLDFGYGLHYTNFSISPTNLTTSTFDIADLSCNATYQDLCPFTTVTAKVQNTGSVTSDFVALAFVSGEYGPQPYPIKQLVSYQRLPQIAGGSSATAQFNLTLGSLARVDENGNSGLYPGDYRLLFDVPTQATLDFTLSGTQKTIDNWPQRPAQG